MASRPARVSLSGLRARVRGWRRSRETTVSMCCCPPPASKNSDLISLAQGGSAQAEGAIKSAGLTVGAVTEAYSDTVKVGDVISQNPAAGSGVAKGSAVDLVISNGPQP